MSRALDLYGTEEPPAAQRTLSAGRLSCVLEDGALREIRWDGVEVIRGIAFLVRDTGWGTPPAAIEEPIVESDGRGFRVHYAATISESGIDFGYGAVIEGDASGRLAMTVEGRAGVAFATNRCGFVVLHPASVGGGAVQVEHVDGSVEQTTFPATISPGQPILGIRALRHEPAPGLAVECKMEAALPHQPEVPFEMEDQRNWSDASFKTYVGSLLDLWPYTIPAGAEVRQRVTVTVSGEASRAAAATESVVALGEALPGRLPTLGIGDGPLTPALIERIAALGLRHLVVTADLADPALDERLATGAALARAMRATVQLELVLACADGLDEECARAAARCDRAGLTVDTVLPCPAAYLKSYQPSGPWPDVPPLAEVYAATRRALPRARIIGGMPTYFTELNRKRPPVEAIDLVSHTTCPIVHAADDLSVMETLEALPAIAASVRAFCPGVPYRIGPSSLAMRHNPYGAGPVANPDGRRVAMADRDPRQQGRFAAAWTVGYVAALTNAGLDALALHHAGGPSGLLDAQGRSLPVYDIMRALAASSGQPGIAIDGLPPSVAGVAWQDDAGVRIGIVANLTTASVTLKLSPRTPAHPLIGASSSAGMLELDAFGVAQLTAAA